MVSIFEKGITPTYSKRLFIRVVKVDSLGDDVRDAIEFIRGRLEDPETSGDVEKQVFDGDLSALVGGARFGLGFHRLAIAVGRLVAARRVLGLGQDGQLGHVADGGQRLTPEGQGFIYEHLLFPSSGVL